MELCRKPLFFGSRLRPSWAAVAALPLAAPSARAGTASVDCGLTVGPGASVHLTAEITECPSVAINVVGPVVLDGGGVEVSCSAADHDGIVVTGKGAKISNLEVSNCEIGIHLLGEGKHSVTHVYGHGNEESAILVESDANKIVSNILAGDGFTDDLLVLDEGSSKNQVRGNLLVEADGDGVDFRGSLAKIQNNFVVGCADSGIDENSDVAADNKVQGNIVHDSAWSAYELGYELGGVGAKVIKNLGTASGEYGLDTESPSQMGAKILKNVIMGTMTNEDMYQDYADCGTNTWKKNVFSTASQSCVH